MGGTVVDPDPAALECTALGRPEVLHWGARTWLVSDSPTPLEDALGDLLTHPLPVRGWRFQGTSTDRGDTLVFDVLALQDGWRVLHAFR